MAKLNSDSTTAELLDGILVLTKELVYRFRGKVPKAAIETIEFNVGLLARTKAKERKKQ